MWRRDKGKPMPPRKIICIERKVAEEDADEIERQIEDQLAARKVQKEALQANPPAPVERKTYSNQAPPNNEKATSSSKKVVKKRVVKMMKDGQLVGEREEILDEDGNVIRAQARGEYGSIH